MKLDYTVQVWKEGKQYIAHAMPLDVASSGATPEALDKLWTKRCGFSSPPRPSTER